MVLLWTLDSFLLCMCLSVFYRRLQDPLQTTRHGFSPLEFCLDNSNCSGLLPSSGRPRTICLGSCPGARAYRLSLGNKLGQSQASPLFLCLFSFFGGWGHCSSWPLSNLLNNFVLFILVYCLVVSGMKSNLLFCLGQKQNPFGAIFRWLRLFSVLAF